MRKQASIRLALALALTAVGCLHPQEFHCADYELSSREMIERSLPELKGRILTAPEYLERQAQSYESGFPAYSATLTLYEPDGSKKTFSIPPNGYLDLPYSGEIAVTGLSARELAKHLVTVLGPYYKRIVVRLGPVLVDSTAPEVPNPALFHVVQPCGKCQAISIPWSDEPPTLLSIPWAATLEGRANQRRILLLRTKPGLGLQPLLVLVDLIALVYFGDLRQNVPLQEGDIVLMCPKGECDAQFKSRLQAIRTFLDGEIDVDELSRRIAECDTVGVCCHCGAVRRRP